MSEPQRQLFPQPNFSSVALATLSAVGTAILFLVSVIMWPPPPESRCLVFEAAHGNGVSSMALQFVTLYLIIGVLAASPFALVYRKTVLGRWSARLLLACLALTVVRSTYNYRACAVDPTAREVVLDRARSP